MGWLFLTDSVMLQIVWPAEYPDDLRHARVILAVSDRVPDKRTVCITGAVLVYNRNTQLYNRHDIVILSPSGGISSQSLTGWIRSLDFDGIKSNQSGDVYVSSLRTDNLDQAHIIEELRVMLPLSLSEFTEALHILKTRFHRHDRPYGNDGDMVTCNI